MGLIIILLLNNFIKTTLGMGLMVIYSLVIFQVMRLVTPIKKMKFIQSFMIIKLVIILEITEYPTLIIYL